MVTTAKLLQPEIQIALRTHSEDESDLRQEEIGRVFYGEEELANGMCKHILAQYARPACLIV